MVLAGVFFVQYLVHLAQRKFENQLSPFGNQLTPIITIWTPVMSKSHVHIFFEPGGLDTHVCNTNQPQFGHLSVERLSKEYSRASVLENWPPRECWNRNSGQCTCTWGSSCSKAEAESDTQSIEGQRAVSNSTLLSKKLWFPEKWYIVKFLLSDDGWV